MEKSPLESFFKDFGFVKLAGLILLVVGVFLGIWLVSLINQIFTEPESVQLLAYLAEQQFEMTFTANDQVFRLFAPDILTYGVMLILLSTLIRIVSAFVTLGGNLMRGR